MPVPTNVRVESNNPLSTIFRWDYSGSDPLHIYKSTDGSSYGYIESLDTATREWTDTDVTAGTRYWYKVTDDEVSYSDAVNVTTHVAATGIVNKTGLSLSDATDLEDLKLQLQAHEQNQNPVDPCVVCPENGALVFDCSFGCIKFEAVASEDINSISIVGCPPLQCPEIDIIIPPDTTREICGWPTACGHEGDECFDAPISGGTEGKTLDQEGQTYQGYGRRLGRSSGGCNPGAGNALTVVADPTSISCNTPVRLEACGGIPPYSWSISGAGALSNTSGPVTIASITPNGDGVAAAIVGLRYDLTPDTTCDSGNGCDGLPAWEYSAGTFQKIYRTYDCDGNVLATELCPDGVCPEIEDIDYCTTPAYVVNADKCSTPNCSGSVQDPNVQIGDKIAAVSVSAANIEWTCDDCEDTANLLDSGDWVPDCVDFGNITVTCTDSVGVSVDTLL